MALIYDGTSGITFNDGSQIGSASQMGIRNRIINGDFRISQYNANTAVTPTTNTYVIDRWRLINGGVSSKLSTQQMTSTTSGYITPPVGFATYLNITSQSAYSVSSSDRFHTYHVIEGINCADLAWGTANAKAVTISFWVQSSLTGTFGGAIQNNAANRSYPFSYTINSANTWQYVTVTIPGDTTGTWLVDNNGGLFVYFGLGCGSSVSGTSGVWAAADYRSSTGAVSVVGTNAATFYITGVQLEKGSVATPFDYRLYGKELLMCQRYYWKVAADGGSLCGFGSGQFPNSTTANLIFSYPATMRAAPSMAYSGTFNVNGGSSAYAVSAISAFTSTTYGRIDATVSGATGGNGAAGWLASGASNYVTASAEL
jgi:hypothetical protein